MFVFLPRGAFSALVGTPDGRNTEVIRQSLCDAARGK